MTQAKEFHSIRRTSAPIYLIEDRGYETKCWVWQRSKNDRGYGKCQSNEGKLISAHKLFWELENGKLAGDLELDHLCRNRGCVNPAHLEPVSHAENSRRSSAAILTPEAIREIRSRCAIEPRGIQLELARKYGVTPTTICSVLKGRLWNGVK